MKYLSILLFVSLQIQAAPHPLTGSSIVNNPNNSLAFSQMGFTLDKIPQDWLYTKNITLETDAIELGPENKTLLSFKLENVSKSTLLENYVRQYLRDYNQYGFEVLSLQSDKKTDGSKVTVDVKQKNKNVQSRQVFFQIQNKIIIATCADQIADFNKTVTQCNEILSNLKWQLQ